jgi:DNA polymerase III alpha subunit (gram-positive type)
MTEYILGIDFETTGKDTSKDEIIEIGAVLWDVEKAIPVKIISELLWHEDIWKDATATKERIEQITKISYESLVEFGISPQEGLLKLADLMKTPNIIAVVAHNGNEFDKPLLLANAKKFGVEFPELTWIDSMIDIPYNVEIQTRKLSYLATEHGFINPFAHRAIFDVLTMLKVVQQYDIHWIIKLSKESSVTLVAATTPPWQDSGKSNEEAKSRGFRYHSETKRWIKNVKESQVQAEKAAAPFSISELR